jgi:peptidoglycan/LPS O-acetylase OafA/YrhL
VKRPYEIDLLRIIAALAAVIFHYTFSGDACRGGASAADVDRTSR